MTDRSLAARVAILEDIVRRLDVTGLHNCDQIVLGGPGVRPSGIIAAPAGLNPDTAPSLLWDSTTRTGTLGSPAMAHYPDGTDGDGERLVWVRGETPTPAIDGTTTVFRLGAVPVAGSLLLVLSGNIQLEGGTGPDGFSLAGNIVTFNLAPGYMAASLSKMWLRAWYQVAA